MPDARAANRRWSAGNGNFDIGGNWTGGIAPGTGDVAQFGRSSAPFQLNYTVGFAANATNQALHVEDDVVTFDLNGRTYAVTAADGIAIGNQPGGLSGSLTVKDGTINSTTNIDVGAAANTSGTLAVDIGGLISGSPNLNVGKLGAGTLTVLGGGDISITGSTTIGAGAGVTGQATIVNESSTLVTGALNVGSVGIGTVFVQFGGMLQNNGDAVIGSGSLFTGVGTGTVNVSADSTWKSLGLLEIGDGGSGEVNITFGGNVMATDSVVGASLNGTGEVNVIGASSVWDNSGTLTVGALGDGTLNIINQGVVKNTDGYVGSAALGPVRGSGTVNVTGNGSIWRNSTLYVGGNGDGTLAIMGGGTVQSDTGVVGNRSTGTGLVTVDGDGSLWGISGVLTVGDEGDATLEVTGGGRVTTFSGRIGYAVGGMGSSGLNGTGHVLVDGAGSLWQSSGAIFVGNSAVGGDATLEITDGGKVQVNAFSLVNKGRLTVDGAGSLWSNNDVLIVGNDAEGSVEITDGGTVSTKGSTVGFLSLLGDESLGTVTVSSAVAGAESIWDINGNLGIGYDFISLKNSGVGKVHIQLGGAVNVTLETVVSAGDLLSLEGGTLTTHQIRFPDGGNDTNFQWTSGTLHVVEFDGSLLNQGGVLAPANTTDILGNYTQLAGATLEIEVGGTAPGAGHDAVHVGANAILGGDLELALIGSFVPSSSDTFTVLMADLNILSSFANVTNGERLITSDGLGSFVVNYGAGSAFDPSQIVLSNFLSTAIPGDYNQNGVVDAADYTIWRDKLGSANSLPNDDTPGVAQDDYDRWKARFGDSLGGGAGQVADVPEPKSIVLIGLIALSLSNLRMKSTIAAPSA